MAPNDIRELIERLKAIESLLARILAKIDK